MDTTKAEHPRAGMERYIVLALITIVLAFSTGDRATLSVAGPSIQRELGIDPVQMGWLFSAFAWAYVVAHIPVGPIVDKLGTKRTMGIGLIVWSICTFLMGTVGWFASPFVAMLILRVALGTFESPVGPASARTIAAWFPAQERGIAGAIFNSAQYLSLVVFTPLMGFLDHVFGWQHVFSVMGLLGIALGVLWMFVFHVPLRNPRVTQAELDYIRDGGALVDLDSDTVAAKAAKGATLQDFAALFKSRMLVGIFISQYCISSITWFFVSWFPTYLVKALNLSILQAGFVASIPAICGFIGGVSTGFISDWMFRRTGSLTYARKVPVTIGLLMTSAMILCNYTRSEFWIVAFMSMAFFGKGFGSLGWTIIADTAPKKIIGTTGALMNAIGNSAGIVTPLVIGYILASTGSFNGALMFVGLHGIVAILAFWVIVGPIQRLELADDQVAAPNLADKPTHA